MKLGTSLCLSHTADLSPTVQRLKRRNPWPCPQPAPAAAQVLKLLDPDGYGLVLYCNGDHLHVELCPVCFGALKSGFLPDLPPKKKMRLDP